MLIPVVLKDGNEELVRDDELQSLLSKKQIVFFKRFDGWVVLGRDKMRGQIGPYHGVERRQNNVFFIDH